MRFFYDMDGVLYDFDKKFAEVMPGVDMENDSAWSWEQLHQVCPDIYSSGELMPGILEVWDYTLDFGDNLILTAIPRRWIWPNATKHKREWAMSNLPIHHEQVRFGPFAEDKQYHCRSVTDVLIDDRIRNIEQWRARGGIGIHHTSPKETLAQLKAIIR